MLIVGAGPAGLATALACHAFGLECQVLDRYDDLVRGRGGLQITPNGMAVLRALGVADRLMAVAEPVTQISIANLATGRWICDLAIETLTHSKSSNYVLLKRSDLIGILWDAVLATGIKIDTGQCVNALAAAPAGIEWHTTSGHSGLARVVVGADGINSLVRRCMIRDSAQETPSYRVWRTTVASTATGVHIRPGHVSLHVGKGRHLVRYRNGMRGDINVVAVEEIRGRKDGLPNDPPAWLVSMMPVSRESFVDPAGRVHTLAKGTLRRPAWYSERMVLIGDALHPMLPFLAQGANMALEDAFVLARSLARTRDPAEGFEQYRQERTKRVQRVIGLSNRQAALNHRLLPRLGRWGAAGLGALNTVWPDLIAHRYRWILAGDVTRS